MSREGGVEVEAVQAEQTIQLLAGEFGVGEDANILSVLHQHPLWRRSKQEPSARVLRVNLKNLEFQGSLLNLLTSRSHSSLTVLL